MPSADEQLTRTSRSAPAASDEFARLERDRRVGRLLRRLPASHRKVLVLRLAFGYSAEETARLLEMPSAGAVRVAQYRALRRARRLVRGTS